MKCAALLIIELTSFQKKEKYQWRWIVKGSGGALYQSLLGLYDISGIRIEADPLYL